MQLVRSSRRPLAALAALAVMLVGVERLWQAQARPAYSPEELAAQVTIRRDEFGVPHILAPTEPAVYFAMGYVTAEDHLLEVARLFLKARGEEAAYFGEQFAEFDLLVKQFRIHEIAAEGYRKSPPWMQAIYDAYAAGYNRYIEKHRASLPEWVKPVTGIDVLAHARRVINILFTMNLQQIFALRRGQAEPPPPLDDLRGSNMWAIGRERSATGRAILLGNPHLAWSAEQIFHEMHITVPGKVNFSGATLIGIPALAIGFNEHLGWSHTVNPHDSDDIYELTLDQKDPLGYIYDGRSIPLSTREISIQVKTDAGLVTRKQQVYDSHYGPVVHMKGDKAYAFKSAAMDEYRFLEQWNLMGKAKNLAEFRRVLDMQAIPMFNICYADREGNIFYLFNGRFPDRPAGYNWSGIVPGNTSATEWNSILPQARLPHLVNPPGGYVQNSNSSPWYTNLRAIIDRRQFPEDLTPNSNSLRTQLSLAMLEADQSITLEEVLRYKYNTRLMLADRIKSDLIRLARERVVDGVELDEAAALLQDWNNTVSRDSRGSLLFVTFVRKYRPKAKPFYAVEWDEKKPASTPHGIGDEAAAVAALAEAMKELRQKYGRIDVPWGEVHRLRRGSLDVPIGGETDEVGAFRIIGYRPDKDGKMVAAGGDSYVLAVEFTSPPTAYSIVAYSQSDDPNSPHHTDQSKLFAEEKWKRAWFTEEDIARNAKRVYKP